MIDSTFDYVDPQKVRENTREFLARKPQTRAYVTYHKPGSMAAVRPVVG